MVKIEKSVKIGGRLLTLSTGHIAVQANGAVIASYGETVVLATVVAQPLKSDVDYFPLSVEYQEKLYAGGRIKGSRWVKREGRPSDEEILTARLIDRSIRPLFPYDYKKEVQVIITVLSVDLENSPEIVAAIATSAAVSISNIPWEGPVSIVRVGRVDGKYIVNPTESDLDKSDLDLIVSTKANSIVMIEAGASQISEAEIIKSVGFAQKESKKIIKVIEELRKEVGKKKEEIEKPRVDKTLRKQIKNLLSEKIKDLVRGMATRDLGYGDYEIVKQAVYNSFAEDKRGEVSYVFDELFKEEVRKLLLSGKRPDGRGADQIRKVTAKVAVLPRTHGSALFERGQTQALSVATLGAPSLEQFIETAEGEETKRYIHHYIMPPYSLGEVGRLGFPSRREIGHGALAERALLPVIPSEEEFPYTIQVVTEILSSNGSTSMASTCGSTLSLMDAGVPIKEPIAGIAMGLVIEDENNFIVLSDIVGLEDGNGDMDFKVAGSENGITALQLDVKTLKLTTPILEVALKQAKKARLAILNVMTKEIAKSRRNVSQYAPKIKIIKIKPEKIGELIGPGGKTIKKIIAETKARIDVDDDGTVFVSASSEEELAKGVERVEFITKEPVSGEIYKGVVKRIQPFGVFVEIFPGKEGFVHVSDISERYVKNPSDLLKVDDQVQVRVKGKDELDRINLSMVMDPAFDKRKEEMRREAVRNRRRVDKKERPRSYEGRRHDSFSGPHFPTSRYLGEQRRKNR